ncbi:MAG: trypsin-like peptidase domain-containing protein [Lachnospiraceae bacterium]|nr:trypsin-like peptidase domain-containing protein [Lachnospiraceae bacterium]
MDDRYRKNGNHNTPFFTLLLILTVAAAAVGVYKGLERTGRLPDTVTALLREDETETSDGENAGADGNGTPAADSDGVAEPDSDEADDENTAAGNGNTADGADSESAAEGSNASENEVDVVAVVKKAMPTVVAITNKSVQEVEYMFSGTIEMETESTGSGIIIGQNDTELLIATNYHVIEGASTLTVCFSVTAEDGEDAIVEASTKGSDEEYDLAVVAVALEKIPDTVMEQIGSAALGSSEELVIGEPAIAIGNALGYGQSVTLGIVSALDRSIEIDGVTRSYIQTDAAINAGNSGGALLNADGEVIGINSAKVASSGVEGMGYAIPIDDAKPVLSVLMERETRERVEEAERGYLGVYTQDISTEARSLYDIPNGVYVTYVVSGSPAEDAGMQSGDIISSLDGVTVSSASGFEDLLEYYRAGETVEVEILRSDKGSYASKTLSVTFAQQPEADSSGYEAENGPFGNGRPFMR